LNYEESLAFIDSYINYETLPDYRWTQATFRLDRMFRMLELVGNPQDNYPCAHVAGTKGKGSTSTFIASVLSAHGKKTGLYVSPHVLDLRERISINGRWIGCEDFADIISLLRPVIEKVEKEMIPATYFEILTAVAMLYFSRESVDCAVFEVGIGGRLDATSVVKPVVSVITSIGYDHMDKLGTTLAEIAGEKCGIIKNGVPVVSASQKPEAMEVIEKISGERECPISIVGREIKIIENAGSFGGFSIVTPLRTYKVEELGIRGIHQGENAACATGAIEHFEKAGLLDTEETKLSNGLANAKLKARFELVPGEPDVLLDGAHNEASLAALADTLRQHPELMDKKKVAVVGLAGDKDLKACLLRLAEITDEFVFTRTSNPRAADPAELLEIFKEISGKPAIIVRDIAEAYKSGTVAAGEKGLVIVAGSFYLAGDVASIIMKKSGIAGECF